MRNYSSNIVEEHDFWVQNIEQAPEINNAIKMEVGIEDCLHIEFEYDKSRYHLKDVILGKIFFLLVKIKIKVFRPTFQFARFSISIFPRQHLFFFLKYQHMELTIIRRESTGHGANVYNESETITKFEIMDGSPADGESIPVRLFLDGFKLTPTYKQVNNKFSVKYYLNLVLVDEEDRRYYKQQEFYLWRSEL